MIMIIILYKKDNTIQYNTIQVLDLRCFWLISLLSFDINHPWVHYLQYQEHMMDAQKICNECRTNQNLHLTESLEISQVWSYSSIYMYM